VQKSAPAHKGQPYQGAQDANGANSYANVHERFPRVLLILKMFVKSTSQHDLIPYPASQLAPRAYSFFVEKWKGGPDSV
jgi:hypothetical protein